MLGQFPKPRPSPRVARKVWLCGVAVTIVLWAAIAAAIGVASGQLMTLVLDAKLFLPFVLFLAGWTGAWLHVRSRPAEV